MKSGHCPKCNAPTVYRAEKGIGFGNSGAIYVYTSAITHPAPSEDYVCISCGYFERYIADQKKLDEVAKNWERVR